uniref:TraH n=1 Tax=Salmonella enteritidis TaxID=149539 RepID=A0A1B0REY5_SALEN|nr:hypothetical protein pSEN112499_097 [Salmonella enterica subsp. enterica serovar Enteritidis]AKF16297.1 traH [Salmonella enterica subsp. enterica serovar Enteritidis]
MKKNGNFLRYSNFTSGGVMSNSNLISSIELTRKNLRAQIEGLRVEAEDLITKYWIKWKERNHQEINLTRHSKVPKREYLGSYAPKVELIGNARKVTITWHQFSLIKQERLVTCQNGCNQ